MSIIWNTGPAAMRARHNLKLKKNKKIKKNLKVSSGWARPESYKQQARAHANPKRFQAGGPARKIFIYTNRHPQPPAKDIG